jgi:hypothetical protein
MLTLRPYLDVETDGEGRRILSERDAQTLPDVHTVVGLAIAAGRKLDMVVIDEHGHVVCYL